MMTKRLLTRAAAAIGLSAGLLGTGPAMAAEAIVLPSQTWSFSGIFGTYDQAAMQRGFQVYMEVCASCHALDYISFRNLSALGYMPDQIKAIAAESTVTDGPDDEGEFFERPARPSDLIPKPFPNPQAAAAANNGAVPPDLSLMVKARFDGANYVYALLTGYEEPPAGFDLMEGLYYNEYFPGHQIAMAPPLFEDAVEFADGTPATVDQMAHDVTTFLAWAAEPEMEDRKQTGIKVILFLLVFTGLLYAVKRRVWAELH